MQWETIPRPTEIAEERLIQAILEGAFPIDSTLPAERSLASQLGVTRPTLREALQRMARDGWLEIHQGRPTRVRNYWREGNLGVLSALAHQQDHLPQNFIPNLLSVRCLLAPAYTRLAIERDARQITELLFRLQDVSDSPQAFASADFELHHRLTIASGNPIFTLILNGFSNLYQEMGEYYFASINSRRNSRQYYTDLLQAAQAPDPEKAEAITRQVMQDSLQRWQRAVSMGGEE